MNLELYTRGNFRNRVQCYQYHLSWTMMLVGEPQSGAEKKRRLYRSLVQNIDAKPSRCRPPMIHAAYRVAALMG